MEVKLVLVKETERDEVVMPRISFETKKLLQRYMQGYLTCYAKFRKKHTQLYAYDLSSKELVEAISI